jgi:hypothetical protein
MGNTFTNIAATTAAVTNRFVTSVNMANGTYTVANASPVWQGGCFVTATISAVTGNDTPGTLTIVGTDLTGAALTEVLTLVAGGAATGSKIFRTIVTITQAGWVINVGNDTIVVGCAAGSIPCGAPGALHAIVLNNSVAATIVVSDASRTIATIPVSAAAGTVYYYDADFDGYLKVATTSTNDITVVHTRTTSLTYPTYP